MRPMKDGTKIEISEDGGTTWELNFTIISSRRLSEVVRSLSLLIQLFN